MRRAGPACAVADRDDYGKTLWSSVSDGPNRRAGGPGVLSDKSQKCVWGIGVVALCRLDKRHDHGMVLCALERAVSERGVFH